MAVSLHSWQPRLGACRSLLSLLCFGLLSGVCSSAAEEPDNTAPTSGATPAMKEMVTQFRKLEELTRLVQGEYFRPLSREELWQGAFRGMLESLDSQSRYLSTREMALRERAIDGKYHGFGFDWHKDPRTGRLMVIRVSPAGPAFQAGMAPGDELLALGGEAVGQHSLQSLREMLLAAQGNYVIRLRHADDEVVDLSIQRSMYEDTGMRPIEWIDRQQGIACIAIHRYLGLAKDPGELAKTRTGLLFRRQLDELQEQGLRGLILDLRGNAGGNLNAAVEVADCFLDAAVDEGTIIVQQVSRHPTHQATWRASSSTTYPNWPLVCLIDDTTASSAEVTAAALRDHRRAVLVGQASHGKETVQREFALDDGAAIRLTVAKFRTPSGHDLAATGLQPDIVVMDPAVDRLRRSQARKSGKGWGDASYPDAPMQRAKEVLTGILITGTRIGLP